MHLLTFVCYYFVFLVGFAAQVLLQAQASVSSSSNGLTSAWAWVKLHAGSLLPRLFLALILAPVIITMVPDSGNFPRSALYGIAGFLADRLLDSLLFIYGQKLGLNGVRVDTPVAAPSNGDKNGSGH